MSRTPDDATALRQGDDGTVHRQSREILYERFDALAEGRTIGDAKGADAAVLERLAANRQAAESRGWTACALERAAGMGRLTVWGLPPGETGRRLVPDWLPASR